MEETPFSSSETPFTLPPERIEKSSSEKEKEKEERKFTASILAELGIEDKPKKEVKPAEKEKPKTEDQPDKPADRDKPESEAEASQTDEVEEVSVAEEEAEAAEDVDNTEVDDGFADETEQSALPPEHEPEPLQAAGAEGELQINHDEELSVEDQQAVAVSFIEERKDDVAQEMLNEVQPGSDAAEAVSADEHLLNVAEEHIEHSDEAVEESLDQAFSQAIQDIRRVYEDQGRLDDRPPVTEVDPVIIEAAVDNEPLAATSPEGPTPPERPKSEYHQESQPEPSPTPVVETPTSRTAEKPSIAAVPVSPVEKIIETKEKTKIMPDWYPNIVPPNNESWRHWRSHLKRHRHEKEKTSRKVKNVENYLERQIKQIQRQVAEKEINIRQAAVAELHSKDSVPPSELPKPATEVVNESSQVEQPNVSMESPASLAMEQNVIEVAQPVSKRAEEAVKVEKVQSPSEIRPAAFPEKEMTVKTEPVETMHRNLKLPNPEKEAEVSRPIEKMELDVIQKSQEIKVSGQTLKDIYEAKRISEPGLRRLIDIHEKGGDVHLALVREIVEHDRDFERDPILRDAHPMSEWLYGVTGAPIHATWQQKQETEKKQSDNQAQSTAAVPLQNRRLNARRRVSDAQFFSIGFSLLFVIILLIVLALRR